MDRIISLDSWQEEALINQEDFVKKVVQEALQKVISAQFEDFLQAKEYERTDTRNGSYTRQLHTRVGSLTLRVCRDREGKFQTSLFDRYQRSEKALLTTLTEMYVNGVSTRKVTNIVEELCGHSVSKSLVSKLNVGLDEQIQKWRNRPLTKSYPYLIFDARYEKVRDGHVASRAVVVGIGITEEGIREIIGCWVVNSESYEAWDSCFKELKDRGLTGVEYVVTDDNKGLRKALMKYFQGVKLQRCQVHFMRNFLSKLAKKDQKEGIQLLQEVFAANDRQRAMITLEHLISFLEARKKSDISQWLEENIEDTLTVLELPYEHRKKMKSTNMLERFNQELKRRTKPIRIFPNEASCLRLVSTLCQETSEGWSNRKYLTMNV